MNKPKWEEVTIGPSSSTHRLPVPGGWLYRVFVQVNSREGGVIDGIAVSTTFVPDVKGGE